MVFDLISDLHVECWDQSIDWTGQATSPYCIVAGDVSEDKEIVRQTLHHLAECYQVVLYIDGNAEHKRSTSDLQSSYADLHYICEEKENLIYLHSNVVVLNDVAILGVNGWWNYGFDSSVDNSQMTQYLMERYHIPAEEVISLYQLSYADSRYLIESIKTLQKHSDVKRICIISHTVPKAELISHDPALSNSMQFNLAGNSTLTKCFEYDLENKITTWCFGHYHGDIDRTIDGVRYTNNAKGRPDDAYVSPVFWPKRIEI